MIEFNAFGLMDGAAYRLTRCASRAEKLSFSAPSTKPLVGAQVALQRCPILRPSVLIMP
jgi:hypothetical protein